MPDIIVTTPKDQMESAAQEAADCIAAGGGEYFRRFPAAYAPSGLVRGRRVWYVEDGFLRGYAVVDRVETRNGMDCDTTGRRWPAGVYVFMRADSWRWIEPFPMRGFRGYRYFTDGLQYSLRPLQVVGDWLSPRPPTRATYGRVEHVEPETQGTG